MAAGKCSAAHQSKDRGAQPPHQADYACKHHQHRAERDGGNRALKQGGRHMSFFLNRLNGRTATRLKLLELGVYFATHMLEFINQTH